MLSFYKKPMIWHPRSSKEACAVLPRCLKNDIELPIEVKCKQLRQMHKIGL